MVATVDIGRINGFIAAAQYVRNLNGKTPQYLVGGIDYVPLLLLLFLCYCRIHF